MSTLTLDWNETRLQLVVSGGQDTCCCVYRCKISASMDESRWILKVFRRCGKHCSYRLQNDCVLEVSGSPSEEGRKN